ncbi:hypothetical protein ABT390_38615 [Streptomyces aurantiacus]|uniref:Lantibiotic n=1 Tax=Streptomyces aurantiacus JA 4570 TaxID=1286094 RepID=S3ZV46_9ACTN|nr:hypothetical protein [Streptomyces aurantiacus]EPH46639.1 hypothetical protein STRAU_0303 [Streptomyces aurantiacus JA 4570]
MLSATTEVTEDVALDDVFDLDVEIALSSAEPDAAFPTIGCSGSCQTVLNPVTCITC